MSGGSMDYLSYKVEEASFRLKTPERKAFKEHLQKVADAMHVIEVKEAEEVLNLLREELKKIKNNP